MLKPETAFERGTHELVDTTLGWRFVNPALAALHHPYSMGETGENVAERLGVSREDQDAFALASQRRAAAAIAEGRYREQLVPITSPQRKGEPDRRGRATSTRGRTRPPEALARLRPAFREGGTVTAGNSSGINDGAAAALVVEADRARALGLRPMARIVATAVAGVDPAVMGLGPDSGHAQGPGPGRPDGGATWISWS